MRAFASDNYAPAHPDVLAALSAVNEGHATAYGNDPWTAQAVSVIRQHVGAPDADVHLVFNGTGANVVGLSAFLERWETVICAASAHINVDEGGAPERLLGIKLLDLPTADGKLTPALIEAAVIRRGDVHYAQPRVVSITQSTEWGTLYTASEIAAIADMTHRLDMVLHMDGARISNAAAALNCTIAELTSQAGVDVLSFGGTKNGAIGAEAVVIMQPGRATRLGHLAKQSMQLLEQDALQRSTIHRPVQRRSLAAQRTACECHGRATRRRHCRTSRSALDATRIRQRHLRATAFAHHQAATGGLPLLRLDRSGRNRSLRLLVGYLRDRR